MKKSSSSERCNALETVKKVPTRNMPTTVMKKEETRDNDGKVIAAQDVHVPATKYYYDAYRKCEYCGKEDVIEESEIKEN